MNHVDKEWKGHIGLKFQESLRSVRDDLQQVGRFSYKTICRGKRLFKTDNG